MRTFIQGAVVGAAVTASGLIGYAYGGNASNQNMTRPGASARAAETACQVQVGFGRLTVGESCFNGEVMVGSRSGYILCSDITVDCK